MQNINKDYINHNTNENNIDIININDNYYNKENSKNMTDTNFLDNNKYILTKQYQCS